MPRNLDVRLLHYRTDLIDTPPSTWGDLADAAAGGDTRVGVGVPVSRARLRPVRDVLRAARRRRRGAVRRSAAAGLSLAGGARGGALPARPALRSTRHAARSCQPGTTTRSRAPSAQGRAAMVCDWPGSYHLYVNPATCAVADRVGLAALPAGSAGARRRVRRLPLVRDSGDRFEPRRRGARCCDTSRRSRRSSLEARQGAIPCRVSALAADPRRAAGRPMPPRAGGCSVEASRP